MAARRRAMSPSKGDPVVRFENTYFFRCANNPYVRFPKPWNTYFTLPISIPVAERLAAWRVAPNVITVISLIVALCAAVFFYFGDYVSFVIGALLFQASYILDCTDGYVARKLHLSSKFGHWLDHTCDELKKPILLIAMYLGQGDVDPWLWIGGLLYLFSRVLVKTDNTVKAPPSASRPDLSVEGGSRMLLTERQRRLFHRFGIVTLFTSIEAQAIAFVVGPLLGHPLVGVTVAGVLALAWFFYVDGYRYWRGVWRNKESEQQDTVGSAGSA
jgi:hypothetical protein